MTITNKKRYQVVDSAEIPKLEINGIQTVSKPDFEISSVRSNNQAQQPKHDNIGNLGKLLLLSEPKKADFFFPVLAKPG